MEGTLLLPINEDIGKQFCTRETYHNPCPLESLLHLLRMFLEISMPIKHICMMWATKSALKILQGISYSPKLPCWKSTWKAHRMDAQQFGWEESYTELSAPTQIWHVVQNKSTLPHITWNLSCHEVQELQRHKKSNLPLLLISVTVVSAYWISSPFPCITVSDCSCNSPRQEGPILLPLQANK
jgi:hypothetical protein